MTDLETRLADMLHDLAQHAEPVDRLESALHGLSVRRARRSWWPVVAGVAAALLLFAGGLWVVTRDEPTNTIHPGHEVTGVWTEFPDPGLGKRRFSVSVATTDGWFVWGGEKVRGWPAGYGDGAYYERATGKWRTLPQSPLDVSTNFWTSAVWTGKEVVVAAAGDDRPQLAAFDPTSFRWRSIDVPAEFGDQWQRLKDHTVVPPSMNWTSGRVVALIPGTTDDHALESVITFNPDAPAASLQITEVPAAPQVSWFTSDRALYAVEALIGDCRGTHSVIRYDVAADTWTTVDLPHPNWVPAIMEWTPSGLLVAGGMDCTSEQSGVRFGSLLQSDGTWRDVANLPRDDRNVYAPTTEIDGMVVSLDYDGTPFVYDPIGDRWWVGPPMVVAAADRPPIVGLARLVALGRDLLIWSPQASSTGDTGPTGTVFHLKIPDPSTWPAS